MPTAVIPDVQIAPSDIVIQPQEGPQTDFLTDDSDITIYGGSAGGG